jgi:hypothetical protein
LHVNGINSKILYIQHNPIDILNLLSAAGIVIYIMPCVDVFWSLFTTIAFNRDRYGVFTTIITLVPTTPAYQTIKR